MKVIYISKHTIVNLILAACIVVISAIYATGGGLRELNVFLNTQKEIPIYSVETDEKKIALTVDAAWGDQYTDQILDILDRNNVKATFFLVGSWADKYQDKVKKIYERGHEIGNHSSTHPYFTQLDPQKAREEIYATSDKIKSLTGKETVLFRPPFGDYNSQVVKSVKEAGHYCIQWDVDSLDWKSPGEKFIFDRVVEGTGNGSIILFHNNAEQTPKVLDSIIKELKKRGYKFVKLSELIYKDNYYVDHLGRQRLLKP